MTIIQLLRILWAQRWIELATFAVTLLIVAAICFFLPRSYTATAAMFIDVRSPDPIAGIVLPGIATSGYLTTQVDIVKSDRVAQAVVESLKLHERASMRTEWLKATDGKIEIRAWISEFLQKHLRVKPAQESSVIDIIFTAEDPVFAAEVANAFAQSYLAVNLELKLEPAKSYASWFEEQTKAVRDRLEQTQKALSDYQQQAGIIASDERLDFESARLTEMVTQLTQLQAEILQSQNKRNASRQNALAEVMKSNVVNTLKIDIARLESKLKEVGEAFTPSHPQIMRMRQELLALKAQMSNEIKLIAASIETEYQIGKQRELNLLQAIEDQKIQVLAFNKQRDEVNVYKRDVESAQRAFEAVSQRAAQTRLESLSSQTNVVSLSAAKRPTRPSQPRLSLYMLIATCAGFMMAVAVGLLRELSNRRIRSLDDLALLGVPILACISSSRHITANSMQRSAIQGRLGIMRKVAIRG